MSEKRVQFNTIIQNQLPAYVREEFPLISEFLSQYYISQEYQGAPVDLIQNIDSYIKVDNTTNLVESVILNSDITFSDETILVDFTISPTGTQGFPNSYGLIQIDDEIITYTGKTSNSFTGCIRGFSGISSYKEEANPEQLVFSSTLSSDHRKGAEIKNLSILFLKEFLLKTKRQILPGLEDRSLSDNLNKNLFLKQSKDFYLSKGTDSSFKILFKALYNENVEVLKPRDFLLTPSNADYRITNDLVVEQISGNPEDLNLATLFQDPYGNTIEKAYAPITKVEKILSNSGETFYKLSLDAGYSRDIGVNGSTYGRFSVHPTTRIIGQVSTGSSVFDVDSTVGFPNFGELVVNYNDETTGIVSYTSKSINQFYGCSNVLGIIEDASVIGINTFAYGRSFTNNDEIITVRINSVLSDVSYPDDTNYFGSGDAARIRTLGILDDSIRTKNWFYNVSSTHKVKEIALIDSSDKTYQITVYKENYFKIGDSITLIGTNNTRYASRIIDFKSDKSFIVKGQGDIDLSDTYKIKRNILKPNANGSLFALASSYGANVQNVYCDKDEILVSSSSLPSYGTQPLNSTDRSITFSGTFVGDEFLVSTTEHGFYTGDAIYYSPEKVTESYIDDSGNIATRVVDGTKLFEPGLYFVKRVSATTLKFSRSKTDIFNNRFVSIDNPITISNSKIQSYRLKDKTLQSQKLFRKISNPLNDGKSYETISGFTGMLVNGVEILNYKSNDVIYYGKVDSIDVISPGENYDVLNPPILQISDSVGTGATGYVAVSGSLQEIRVFDPGFDYQEKPIITISGGNGNGARASVNMKLISHAPYFYSDSGSAKVGLGVSTSTIGFTTYHKFRNAEQVIYSTNSQKAVGGLSTNSTYFVSVQDPLTIKLHPTKDSAISGINTITLSSYGEGKHILKSYNKKSVVESITIIDSGTGYENKLRTVSPTGISTALNEILIKEHDYKTGEIVKYSNTGTPIGGLSDGSEYYVTRVNQDSFKLSSVGIGTEIKDFYYRTKQFVNITSIGSGVHRFNYPDISVSLVGKIGISSVGTETFEAVVQPVFRGEIKSIHLSDNGVGYGSSEIINFNRQPSITLKSGENAQLLPIIVNGKINEVLVLNSGTSYNSVPNLIVTGDGIGAVVTPIFENGLITGVKVIESGVGYTQQNTSIRVEFSGVGADLKANIQRWRVNLFQKNIFKFTSDDGYITEGINENYELQYSHLYAPRKLRESVFAVDQTGKVLYGRKDLRKVNSIEEPSLYHSPIIGWAYDGNPIYGPFGYSTKKGGVISQMKSGYIEESSQKENRPPLSIFPSGFFVEDFTYYKVNDETVLDENNGRFCVTPEYPNGVYAYFATVNNSSADSFGPFTNYKRPVFPYLIGNTYKSIPNEFNFSRYSNQDDIDLNESDWSRNVNPYNLVEDDIKYEYIYLPNNLSQTVSIKSVTPGSLDSVGILTGGDLYKVKDSIIFDNTDTRGFGVSAEVSEVLGKPVNNISVASSSISGFELYPYGKNATIAFSNLPHNFKDENTILVSGVSTTSSKIDGFYSVGIKTNTFALTGIGNSTIGIGSVGVTGIVTYFNISGNFAFPNIRENDIFTINDEKIKIIKIEPKLSRIRAIREIDGTVGTSHTVTSVLYENPRKLIINSGLNTTYTSRLNKEIYFNPLESIGLGTAFGVGIGTTIFISNPGAGLTQIFIPTKSIYIENHSLQTGDRLTYYTNDGSGIEVVENPVGIATTLTNGQTLYVAKIDDNLIGLSTVRVGLGTTGTFVGIASTNRNSTTLFFTGIGTGTYHSFKTNYSPITAKLSRNLVTVSTSSTHGLSNNDSVTISVNPSISTTVTVVYNDYNRRVLIDPKSFSSVGVNTLTNEITIENHGFGMGEKVVYTSSSPSVGLSNNSIYYIVRIDNNTIKLSDTYYNATLPKPPIIEINSQSDGTLTKVNPLIEVYKDSTVSFDLSDSSLSYINQSTRYPAFQFNFYKDKNFTQIWDKNPTSRVFEIQRSGIVGVTTDAKVTLSVSKSVPSSLYYRLDPIFESNTPIEKRESIVDNEVFSNNEVILRESLYNGNHKINVGSTTSFTYTIKSEPERNFYSITSSDIKYFTNSSGAFGSISKVEIKNAGSNYYSLPGITTIVSTLGKGAIIEASGNNIGRIKKTQIKNIGFNFPSDNTLKPNLGLPQIVKINSLASIESIGISSFGRGYSTAPELLLFDGVTKKIVPTIDLKYTLGNTNIEILKNTTGISNVSPTILPIKNSNGVGISTLSFNSTTKDVTVTLSVGFSTSNSFPFKVNDKVLIENISIGIGSTSRGYNSDNYDYKLFTITAVDENIGGIGTVTYNLSEYFEGEETPGIYDPVNSSGRIIPEKYFPIFNVNLKTNDYLIGETVKSNSASGIVESWDSKVGILRISSSEKFSENEVIRGLSSNTQGIASSIKDFESKISLDYYSKVENGWQANSGVLNDNLQRIQDSFYYQNFSYSLKSKVSYDTWDDPVSALNHTVGFEKFSDYQLESIPNKGPVVGLTTDNTSFEVVSDLVGYGDLNCFYDFDLVKENYLNIDSQIVSDEITFTNRILIDYFESIGNRVLSIDDVSGVFNSNPRPTPFSIVNRFDVRGTRAQKYFTFVTDKRYIGQRQLLVVDLIHDNELSYINQYGRVETQYDLGSFDFSIAGTEGQLLFYPTKYTINDYNVTCISYNLSDSLSGVGSTSIGNVVDINTSSINVAFGTTETIISIGNTYSTVKAIVEITADINRNEYEVVELNIVNDGTNVEILEYGNLITTPEVYGLSAGFGTYSAYIDGSDLKVDFIPNAGIGTTAVVNTIQVAISNASTSGIGTVDLRHAKLETRTTTIASSGTPSENVVGQYPEPYDIGYFIVQVADTTNNRYQMSEVLVVDDYTLEEGTGETYDVEFGNIETVSGLGTIGTRVSAGGTVELLFTPLENIDTQVKVYMNALRHQDDEADLIDFNNGTIRTAYGDYVGTDRDILRAFELKHKGNQIFERYFDASDSDTISSVENTINIPNHFFVTGEKIRYNHVGTALSAITISPTNFPGIGVTEYLPEDLYVVKVSDTKIRVATTAENALKASPETVDITSVGIGTSHRFISTNQNAKVVISLDNIIQSPVVATALTSSLSDIVFSTDDIIFLSGITSFFGGDLLKIGEEIMKIESVGVGSTNALRVRRPWLGTVVAGYSTGDLVTKVTGNYNIVDNTLNFVEAPYGNTPFGTSTNAPDDRDWVGISTGSSFHGRTFLRSGIENTSNETYYKNYVFNDISEGFDGTNREFTLKSNGSNITGISDENAVILINDVFQAPGLINDYVLGESSGITSISFTGTASSISSDVNTANLPVGGVIVSVGSTEGFGYQPLVSAGGTAIISVAGTVQSISVGNTGSGYRASSSYEILTSIASSVGIGSTSIYLENQNSIFEILNLLNTGSNSTIGVGTFITAPSDIISVGSTFVNVGVGSTSQFVIPIGTKVKVKINNPQIGIVNVGVSTSDIGITTSFNHVGFATILTGTGNISTSISITSAGFGYTISNPPTVIFENPLSYSNIPLEYSSSSPQGSGSSATIDIVVGQGSSVIDFSIENTGYGYGQGEVLTVPVGGLTGIPTTSSFTEFQVTIDETFTDEFTGWSIGTLQILDSIDDFIDGERVSFPLRFGGDLISIRSAKGSKINVQDVLLIFVNDILQVPGEGYVFEGGSILTFTEPIKIGDTVKIIFYKGTGDTDVIFRDVLETVKVGDKLQIGYDASIGQPNYLQEESRTVTSINSTDLVETNPYFGPGNVSDENLERPVVWCKQTEDKIINEQEIGKDREWYEPVINPFSYIIKSVGIGSTTIYVDSLRPLFDSQNESGISLSFQNSVRFISQESKVSASATAIVSGLGTISSISIVDGGVGYSTPPTVSIGNTLQSVGLGTTATAVAAITSGIITSITLTNVGTGYTNTNPPVVLVSPPSSVEEINTVNDYIGDYGTIVGFGKTVIGAQNQLIFDFYIPTDSYMRNTSVTGTAVTISGISTNDFFLVYNSNIGSGTTSFNSLDFDGSTIGVGTSFVDNVYQVNSSEIIEVSTGVGLTYVNRVFVRVDDFTHSPSGITTSQYYGSYSWGKVILSGRSGVSSYTSYTTSGITGISTSLIVQRTSSLKYKNYIQY